MTTIKIETILKLFTYIVVSIGYLSVAGHAGFAYSAGFVLVSLASIYLTYRKIYVPRCFLNSAIVVIFAIATLKVTIDNIVVPGIEVLLILIALKFLEEHKARDYMQIYTLSLFLLASSALLSTDMIFIAFFAGLIFMLTVVIVLLAYYSEDPFMTLALSDVYKIVAAALIIPLIVIPLTALFFIILPRTDYPLFDFLNKKNIATSGFSDSVKLGDVSEIQEDSTIAFRAAMEKIDDGHLYWRGIVFDSFDGTSWQNLEKKAMKETYMSISQGRAVNYRVYLEASENTFLITLDKPAYLSLRSVNRYDDFTYELDEATHKRIRYDAMSALSSFIGDEGDDVGNIYLQLTGDLEKIKRLVENLTKGRGSEASIGALYSFLTEGGFRYSLSNLPLSATPLDDFLFSHHYGNCEYFASAMAVMLRVAGIPSRVVGGYRGGYYNEVGGYYAVPQKNAHVWVEAFVKRRGWVRVDPTPAIVEGFTVPKERGLRFRLMISFDIMKYYWNIFVINYDFQKQLSFFSGIKSTFKRPAFTVKDKRLMAETAIVFIALLIIVAIIIFLIKRRPAAERVLSVFLRRMEGQGYRKEPGEGLEELVSRMGQGPMADGALRFVRTFEGYYYRDRKIKREDIKRLKAIVKEM